MWKLNEQTGNFEASITTKLLSVSDVTFESNNEKKTKYKIATVQMPNGKNVNAIMYLSNFNHGVEKGTSYLTKAVYDKTRGDGEVLLVVSHLVAGERATMDDLGLALPEEANALVNAGSEFESVKQ